MRFETSQSMKLGQQMKLAPRMIQSMEILQLSLTELEERIDQELESNSALELDERTAEPASEAPTDHDPELRIDETGDEDFERLDAYERDNPEIAQNEYSAQRAERPREHTPTRERSTGEPDAKMEAMANAPARSASLVEQLLDQWRLADVDDRMAALGTLIIEKLDDDGSLSTPLDQIADTAPRSLKPIAPDELQRALTAVQLLLEPPGIAARNPTECLLLQLDALADEPGWDDHDDKAQLLRVARTLIEHHLDDLIQNRLPKVAERSGFDLDQIKSALQLMRRLSLAPGRRLVASRPEPIIPDAIVEYDDDHDRYFAYLNERHLPNLTINRQYALLSRDRSMDKRDRDFIRTNLSNAQWLIEAVEQRRKTLLRVINVVIEAQRDFFDFGPEAIRPLPMTQVAEQLGIHVATVSRAVAEKYLQTPRGILPLRRFFTGGLQTDSGEDLSYDAVKAALREIIDAEDKAKPFSDEALVKQLKDRGIDIARRTVAKYRGQLNIPSARLRKAF